MTYRRYATYRDALEKRSVWFDAGLPSIRVVVPDWNRLSGHVQGYVRMELTRRGLELTEADAFRALDAMNRV